jgi:pyruvate formate lyase activating enzyme
MRPPLLSATLGLCIDCIRNHPEKTMRFSRNLRRETRIPFGLPPAAPRSKGVTCALCVQTCEIAEGERGYCGLQTVSDGKIVHFAGTPRRGLLHWYRDPLPTNCVADWVCAGFAQRGSHNLAVFYASCTLDCLFCQNWHFRNISPD